MMYSLSIIIPLYNEEGRLKDSLRSLTNFLSKKNKNKIETIFISDGSTDNTNNLITEACIGSRHRFGYTPSTNVRATNGNKTRNSRRVKSRE